MTLRCHRLSVTDSTSTMRPPSSEEQRRQRVPAALFRIADRHAADPDARGRSSSAATLLPQEAVRLVELLAAGGTSYRDGEAQVDADDLVAALTLVPFVRAELDETELALMMLARGREMTWASIALGLGLGSAQAAQQRYERLASRVDSA